MALTMDDGVITVDDNDPAAIAAGVWHLEEEIAGMSPEAVEAMGVDVGTVQSWPTAVLAKITARAGRLEQQARRS